MQNPRLATRYAKSLIDLAVEKNLLEDTIKDMQLLENICRTSQEFTVMLRSPVVNADKKSAVVSAVLEKNVHELTFTFIDLLIRKGREENLPEIATAFVAQYNEMKKIRTVKLTTASAINDNMKELLVSKVANHMSGYTIDLNTAVDENLLGGFVLEVEDQLFDASVRKRLNEVRSQIIDTSYISKM